MATIAELLVVVGAKIDGFERSMGDVSKRLSAVDRDAAKTIAGFDKIGSRLTDVGTTLSIGITAPLVAAALAGTKFSTDFNAAMANVATLIPRSTDRVIELKSEVQDLAVQTGKSTGDIAGGLYQVISAFGDTSDTVKILDINARAAAAGLATTTDAINLTSAVTKGYGDTSAEAVQKVSDLAFVAVKLGQTTFPELAASMGRVVPIAANLAVAQEELFGVMATATGVTGSAAEVSTQLRGILQSLMAPTKEMAGLFENMGIASGKALIEQKGLKGAIETVVGAAQQSGVPLQKLISQIEGQTLALALAGPQADTFSKKLEAMKGVAGATDEAFREQAEGINKNGFTMAQAAVKAEVLAQKFGDALAPALGTAMEAATPLIGVLGKMVDWFTSLPQPVQNVAFGLAAAAAAAGPLLLVSGQLVGAMTQVAGAFEFVSKGMGTLTGGAGLLGSLGSMSSLLPVLTPLLIAFGVAIAAWAIYEGVTQIQALNKELDRLYDAQQRGVKASKDQAEEIGILETVLRKHGKTVESTGKTTEEYLGALRAATKGLDAFKSETSEMSDAAKDLERRLGLTRAETKKLEETNKATSGAVKKTADTHKEAAQDLKKFNDEILIAKYQQWAAEHRNLVTSVATLQRAIESGTSGTINFNAELAELDAITRTVGASIADVSKVEIPAYLQAINTGVVATDQLGEAFRTLGVTTSISLNDKAAKAQQAYETIKESGIASANEVLQAERAALQASIEARRAAGQMISQEEEARLAALNQSLGKHVDEQKGLFDGLKTQVSTIMTDLSKGISDIIFEGKGFGETFKGIFEELGKSVLRFVVEYLEGKLVGAIMGLLDGPLKALGGAFTGIFGGGASTAGGVSGAVGSVASGAGGTAGSVAGAVGGAASGVVGIVGAIGGIGSAISGFIGNFQMSGMNENLQLIENNTRRLEINFANQLQQVLTYLPKLADIYNFLWGPSYTTTREMQDKLDAFYTFTVDSIGGTLGEVRDEIRALPNRLIPGLAEAIKPSLNISITVNGAQSPVATGNELMNQLRAQGALLA